MCMFKRSTAVVYVDFVLPCTMHAYCKKQECRRKCHLLCHEQDIYCTQVELVVKGESG
jgi:hypothetical protein